MPWTIEGVKPTYCCNPTLMKYFRENRGLTQAELAQIAGYSERLINKAESGRSISKDTIADLAEALSSPDSIVYPEDLICDPVVFARQYIDAFYIHQKNAMPHIESFLDESVVFHVQGNPEEIPFAGTFHGPAGVAEMINKFYSVLMVPEDYDHRPHYRYLGSGNEVVIWGKTWIHPIGHPREEALVISILMKFQKGKLIHFEDRYDIKTAAEEISRIRASNKDDE